MQRFASSLIARPVVSSLSRSTLFRAMSVSASQIKEHSQLVDSQGKEFAKVESDHKQHTHTHGPPPSEQYTLSSSQTTNKTAHSLPLSCLLSAVRPSSATSPNSLSHMQGSDKVKLTRDSTGGDVHHLIPLSWVTKVEGNKVHISKTAEEAKSQWEAGQE